MSNIRNRTFKVWEDVEQYVWRNASFVRRNGRLLDPGRDKEIRIYRKIMRYYVPGPMDIVMDALVLQILVMNDLLSLLSGNLANGLIPVDRDIRWIKPWLIHWAWYDLTDIVAALKYADSLLLQSVADDEYDVRRFKHDMKAAFPAYGALMAPMKEAIVRWFDKREPTPFFVLHTFLAFITRINLPGLDDLEEEAYASYVHFEREGLKTSGFTTEEQALFTKWFPELEAYHLYEDWRPKHGPGIVADIDLPRDKLSLEAKYKAMATDARIRYLNLRLGKKAELPHEGSKDKLLRVNKVVFVPKSIDKLRTICAEPTTLMWYQQGFAHAILKSISRNPNLRKRINLVDQDLSRELARKGSIHGNYATIDLSSASDSVSWPLVREWTRRSALRAPLACTRSERSEMPDGKLLATNKFAPMGSALCFPIECLIFCAIVECAITESGGRVSSSNYRVYGDDIIVESEYAEAVIGRLERNGFVVNTKKSFWKRGTRNFRESCGGEYLDGIDVTPIRLSRKFSGYEELSAYAPSQIEALIDLCNQTYMRLPSVRNFVIRKLNELPPNLRPYYDYDGKKGIKSNNPTNHHHMIRPFWHEDYQTFFVEHGFAIHLPSQRQSDESIRLFEWLRLTEGRQRLQFPEDTVYAKILPPGLRVWDISMSHSAERFNANFAMKRPDPSPETD